MKGVIQSISVSKTLKAMRVGADIFLNSDVNENTLRNACVRLKSVGIGAWVVDKQGNKGFIITRTA
jgi:hypothetical protein